MFYYIGFGFNQNAGLFYCVVVGRCLVTKAFIGKLQAVGWEHVIMGYADDERGSRANLTK